MIDYQALGKDFLAKLGRFGYTQIIDVHVHVSVETDNVSFHCLATDNFQDGANWNQKVQSGFLNFLFEDGRFVIPPDFKTREQRELHFMAKRFGNSKELAAQMVSAAGRAFAEKMEAELSTLRTMITKEPG